MDSIITVIEQFFNTKNPIKKYLKTIENSDTSAKVPPVLSLHNEQKNNLFTISCICFKSYNDNINNHYIQWMVHDISGSDIHDGYNTHISRSGITVVPWESLDLNGHEIFIILLQHCEHEHYIFRSRYNGLFDLNTSQYTLLDVSVRQNVHQEELNTFSPHWFASFKSLSSHSFNSM